MVKFHITDNKLEFILNLDHEKVIQIPDNVTIIGPGALSGDKDVEQIIFSPSVRCIKKRAFANCISLQKLEIPETVLAVEEEAFKGCTSLESLDWHPQTIFLEHCFSGCVKLTKMTMCGDEARLFYFPVEDRFAVTKFNCVFPGGDIQVYVGKFAADAFPTSVPPEDAQTYFFTTTRYNGKEYFWYDRDLGRAVHGVVYTAREKTIKEHFKKPVDLDTVISPEDFGLMTGICSDGIEGWLKMIGKDWSWRAPVREVLDGLARDIPGACRRFIYVLQHQNEDLDMHDVAKGLSIEDALRR